MVSILGIISTLKLFLIFDAYVRSLEREENDRWVRLGCPLGFFWRPKNSPVSWLRSLESRHLLFFSFFESSEEFGVTEFKRYLTLSLVCLTVFLLLFIGLLAISQ